MSAPGGVVVTGGTGALGRVVVHALLAGGARVAVPYRAAEDWDALRSSAPHAGQLWGARADLAEPSAAQAFVDEAVGWLGGLHGVAALAGGYAGSGTLEVAPVDEWRDMMSINLGTAYGICRAALPHLLRGGGGSVVTVASKLAESGGAGAAAYAVSKAAVAALTRVLARENQARGVRFNCVMPGIIDTAANRRAMGPAAAAHFVPPEAITRVVLFLLSPESVPVTGAVVPV